MEAIKALIPILLTVSLAGLVFVVGLNSGRGELLYVFRRPALLARAVLAVLVIPPIAAGLLIWALPLTPAVKAGIMLMAVAPVPPLVPGKELKMGGSKEYAYGVYVAMALLTVISVPLVFEVASALFGRPEDKVPMTKLIMTILTGVLLPLALGLLVRRFAPAIADKAAPLIYKLSMLLVLLAFLPILVAIWPALEALIGNGTLLAMAVVTVICIAAGHMLGGPERLNRATLAVAASVRHPGIAIALAGANFVGKEVQAAVLLYLLVGLVVGALYGVWLKRSAPAHGAPAAP
ncbi:hypothetical protein ASC65_15845 [Brevundimonas sp. Root1279]|nr:hypothetical protein ASC65_15845 [Brevundimonas sp. Root1279]